MHIYILLIIAGLLFGNISYVIFCLYVKNENRQDVFVRLFPSLYCSCCLEKINSLNVIPLFGYFLSGRKCPSCGKAVSIIYHIFILLNGFMCFFVYSQKGVTFYSLNIFLLMALSVLMSIIDVKKKIIPNVLVIVFLALSVYPVLSDNTLKDSMFGLLLMGVFFILVLIIFPGSFGGGDVKYAACLGLILGFELSIVALQAALISGSVAGVLYAIFSGKGLKSKMAFAPFLAFGFFTAFFYGRGILAVYYRLIY